MQLRDKINKAAWMTLQSAKDVVTTNVTKAVTSGQLKVDANQLPLLLQVITASIEDGYHRSNRNFLKVVDAAIAAEDAAFEDLTKKNR